MITLFISLLLVGAPEEGKSLSPYWIFPSQEFHPSKSLEQIETQGGRLRTVSFLLKGVSAYITKKQVTQLSTLTGVKEIIPVKRMKHLLSKPVKIMGIQFEDSTYGYTLNQLKFLNIPRVHRRGVIGQDVTIGMLDNGFDFHHLAVKHLKDHNRVVAEHDFNSGDHFRVKTSTYDTLINYSGGVPYLHSFDAVLEGGGFRIFFSMSHDTLMNVDTVLGARNIWMLKTFLIDQSGFIGQIKDLALDTFAIQPSAIKLGNKFLLSYARRKAQFSIVFKAFDQNLDSLYTTQVTPDSLDAKLPELFNRSDTLILFFLNKNGFSFSTSQDTGKTWDSLISITDREVNFYRVRQTSSGFEGVFTSGNLLREDSLFYFSLDSTLTQDTLFFVDKGFSPNIMSRGDTLFLSYIKTTGPEEILVYRLKLPGANAFLTEIEIDRGTYFYSPAFYQEGGTLYIYYSKAGYVYRQVYSGNSFVNPELKGYLHTDRIFSDDGILVLRQRGDNNTGYEPLQDNLFRFFHGTHMLGLIAGLAKNDYIGAAPGARFVLAKTERVYNISGEELENIIEEDFWVEGLEWSVSQGVQLVSSSLGYILWYDKEDMDGKTSPASRAASKAIKKNVLVFTAAGNVGARVDTLTPDTTIHAPGDADSVLTIGGGHKAGNNFWADDGSAFGPTADGRIKPDLLGPWNGSVIDVEFGEYDTNSFYATTSGTSVATALMTGGAALLLEAHPSWSARKLMKVLKESSSNYPPHPDSSRSYRIGWGAPDMYKALFYEPPEIPLFPEEPLKDKLFPPYPNPWKTDVRKFLSFPYIITENETYAEFRIYDLSGTLVYKKDLDFVTIEKRTINWDGKNLKGQNVPSGIYIAVLYTGFEKSFQKFAIVR